MELRPRGAPLPTLFAELRRRDPDVDIVLLPPEEPDRPVSDLDPDDVLARTVATTASVWSAGEPTEVGFDYGPDPASVVARTRTAVRLPDSPVPDLTGTLAEQGWQVLELPGAVPRLVAHRDDVELTASYAAESGFFLLTLVSAPLVVGADRARALVRG